MIKDTIKELCAKRGTTFSQLEKELGFSNGSLAKSDGISAERLWKIAQHFGVTMTSIVAPMEENKSIEKEQLLKQNELLRVKATLLDEINQHYDAIARLRDEVAKIDISLTMSKGEKEHGRREICNSL